MSAGGVRGSASLALTVRRRIVPAFLLCGALAIVHAPIIWRIAWLAVAVVLIVLLTSSGWLVRATVARENRRARADLRRLEQRRDALLHLERLHRARWN